MGNNIAPDNETFPSDMNPELAREYFKKRNETEERVLKNNAIIGASVVASVAVIMFGMFKMSGSK